MLDVRGSCQPGFSLASAQDGDPEAAAVKEEPGGAAAAPPAAPRGVPREDWEESDEDFGEENVGQWSPQPVPASEIRGLEVVSQAQDERMLQLLRAQVSC